MEIPEGKDKHRWVVEIKGLDFKDWTKMAMHDHQQRDKADRSVDSFKKAGYEARVVDTWS